MGLVLPLCLIVAACGGGGGGSESTTTGQGMSDVDPTGSEQGQGDVASMDDMSATLPEDDETATAGAGSGTGEVVDDSNGGPTAVAGGSTVRLLALQGDSPGGVPEATLTEIENLEVHPAGAIAYTGVYEIRPGQRIEGVWAGPATAPMLVLGEMMDIEGLNVDYRFDTNSRVDEVDVASDGSVAIAIDARRQNAAPTGRISTSLEALVVADAMGTRVLHQDGDVVPGLNGDQIMRGFSFLSRSSTGVAFISESVGGDPGTTLWVSDASGTRPIIENSARNRENVPTLEDCQIVLGGVTGRAVELMDTGELVFTARLSRRIGVGQTGGRCERTRDAIMRSGVDGFSSVVSEGDAVPDAPGFTFGDISLIDVLSDGTVFFEGVVTNRTSVQPGQSPLERRSWWLFGLDTPPRLALLEGELLQRTDGEGVVGLGNVGNPGLLLFDSTVVMSDTGALGLHLLEIQTLESLDRLSLYAGFAHQGQPHGSLLAPGTSALTSRGETYASTALPGTALVAPFAENERLLNVGIPGVDGAGNLVFHAQIWDTQAQRITGNWILRSGPDGNIDGLIGPTDRISVNGAEQLLLSGVLSSGFGIGYANDEPRVTALSDGSFVLFSIGEFSIGRKHALVHVLPQL